jgi:hypothetical protein
MAADKKWFFHCSVNVSRWHRYSSTFSAWEDLEVQITSKDQDFSLFSSEGGRFDKR